MFENLWRIVLANIRKAEIGRKTIYFQSIKLQYNFHTVFADITGYIHGGRHQPEYAFVFIVVYTKDVTIGYEVFCEVVTIFGTRLFL